jgi:transcriptional regulator with GAF, ATPase, and Fis domain
VSTDDHNRISPQPDSIAPALAIRSTQLASGSASTRRDHPHVVVHAHDENGFKHIADALEGSRFTTQWMADAAVITRLPRDGGDVIVIAVTSEPAAQSPILKSIDEWKRRGFIVVCCGRGIDAWTLGAKSRLLIVGAAHVLDTSEPGFAAELHGRLSEIANAAADRQRDDQQIAEQMRTLGMVGKSPAITALFRWIVRVSPVSSLPVLLMGETGTGKELAARAIHALDPRRRRKPFVPVNCGAMSPTLAESELFGHRRGAFTGADHDRRGLIRAADGGVLFLDEIGDLELSLQAKLLRVLQERRVLSLGEDHEVPIDVRVIAATNRDLEEMVRAHQFRADLFHRLSALSIRLPTLRERPEDIAPLVERFVSGGLMSGRVGKVVASAEFVEALRSVRLPGNVRQLENVVHSAMVCPGRGELLRLRDLSPDIWRELAERDAHAVVEHGVAPGVDTPSHNINPAAMLAAASGKLERALDLCEEEMIAAALTASNGNQSRAARMLGISPRTFFNKMRKHRLTA